MAMQLFFVGVVLLIIEGLIPGFGFLASAASFVFWVLCILSWEPRPRRRPWWAVFCWYWCSWVCG